MCTSIAHHTRPIHSHKTNQYYALVLQSKYKPISLTSTLSIRVRRQLCIWHVKALIQRSCVCSIIWCRYPSTGCSREESATLGLCRTSSQALSSLQVASFLIRRGADVNLTDVDRAAPRYILRVPMRHLDLMSFLIKSGAFLSLERVCDRSLILDMLKKEPQVNRIMLYNILQENALLPHPKPGCNFRVYRCTDVFENNIHDVIDPHRLRMLYTLGYHISSSSVRLWMLINVKASKTKGWTGVLEHITATDNKIQRLSEICRFSIRSYLVSAYVIR